MISVTQSNLKTLPDFSAAYSTSLRKVAFVAEAASSGDEYMFLRAALPCDLCVTGVLVGGGVNGSDARLFDVT